MIIVCQPRLSIKAVSKRTGLSPHVIRVWEKRYGAIKPLRTSTNRRIYSEEDTNRLLLLRKATLAGYNIGSTHSLTQEQLVELIDRAILHRDTQTPELELALRAVHAMDDAHLMALLEDQVVTMGQHGLLERFITPLTYKIGELWERGVITAAHEHFCSALIRAFLSRNSRPYASNGGMPSLVVATPSGQLHEMGAVIVGAAAADAGWRVVYLGASLPASEIAGAAVQSRARAVALSIVYPGDDPSLPLELENLRCYMPAEICILAGGRSAAAYSSTLTKIGASRQEYLGEFRSMLDQIRRSFKTPKQTF